MKWYLIALGFLFGFAVSEIAHAEECSDYSQTQSEEETLDITTDVPGHLKGATITVTLADGKQSTVPAEKFKVVPRTQQFIVNHTLVTVERTCKTNQKNRVSLLAGKGPKEGLDRSGLPSDVKVESRVGTTGGLQYQYLTDVKVFKLPLSVGGQVQSNKSGSILLGLDF